MKETNAGQIKPTVLPLEAETKWIGFAMALMPMISFLILFFFALFHDFLKFIILS